MIIRLNKNWKQKRGTNVEDKIYCLSEDYSLFKGDFKEKKFRLFNIKEGTIFNLNEVSYDMLSLFDGEKTMEGLLIQLKKMYNIEEKKLKNDLYNMMKEWIEKKILIERS
jgi:hypothetical protein